MIEKLRRKFILYATASVLVLLLLILGTINLVNFGSLASDADQVTSLLAQNGGVFSEPGGGPLPGEQPGPGPLDPINPETKMSTRYFTVRLDEAGTAYMVKMNLSERTVTPEEALTWGASLATREKGWTRTTFRFRTYQYNQQTYVSVIDYNRELSPSYRVLWSSLLGSGLGLLITFLVLIPVSKVLVKPLEVSQKKQRRFISDASHELKTPLTVISANKDIIEAEHGESEATVAIAKQVSRMTSMVKNLNALARMDEEEKHPTGKFDLAGLAQEIVSGFEPGFAAKNVQFTTEIPEKMPFNGDESMLSKLLSILLDNALKYSLTTAEFHLYRVGERTCIKVINDAEGIEDESLDRVFERFYRSDVARASSVEGSGIGLSIAKEIVKAHGGRIMAKGQNGRFVIKAEF